MIIMALAILILCIFPEIVTWLPDKIMGKALDINKKINRKISVAPMMDCTDRHDRFFKTYKQKCNAVFRDGCNKIGNSWG